jgi:hypothetical protein
MIWMDGWMDGWEKHTTQIREWMEEERERGRTDDAPNQTKKEEESFPRQENHSGLRLPWLCRALALL